MSVTTRPPPYYRVGPGRRGNEKCGKWGFAGCGPRWRRGLHSGRGGLQVPGRPLEHLVAVPVEVLGGRPPFGPLRLPDLFPVVAEERLLERHDAVDQLRDEQHLVVPDGERSQVEHLVVQRAEGKPVTLQVGAVGLVPADVGRVESDGHGPELQVEPAHGATELVGDKYTLAELWVALPDLRRSGVEREADLGQDVRVERLGEVLLEHAGRDLGDE